MEKPPRFQLPKLGSLPPLPRKEIKPEILSPLPRMPEAPLPKLPPLKTSVTEAPLPKLPLPVTETPVSIKSPLPPLSKLPPLKTALPTLKTIPVTETPVSIQSPLPPLTKLAPLKPVIQSPLPPLTKLAPLKPVILSPPIKTSPLVKEIRENKEEQIAKITEEVLGLSEEFEMELKPLQPLPAFVEKEKKKVQFELPSIPSPPSKTALMEAQEGVQTGKLIEPEAAFQKAEEEKEELSLPKLPKLPKVSVPPLSSYQMTPVKPFPKSPEEKMTSVASPANLPSRPSKEPSPTIRIPKIQSPSVRPSPSVLKTRERRDSGIRLPEQTTVIPSIPIMSPSVVSTKTLVAKTSTSKIAELIKTIDVSKLKAERSTRKDTYSVAELKSIAGSLNLTKSGSKKDLIEKIRAAILKVDPTRFD